MARVAVVLTCTAEQRGELMALARSRTEEARLVERAKIVLACLEGKRNDAVGREFGVRPNTVGLWRKRFAAAGLAGLRDRARPGKTAKYGADLRLRVLRLLELPPPKGSASWDGASLAAALGASDDAVWRLLRREGVQLRRRRSWCVSTDPQFAAKAADIIGLYLNPPENALVLSVDEKPTIQALERASGYVLTSSGKIVHGLKSTYKRHGTVNLFAALEVATGVIRGKTTPTKKRVDFQAFMTDPCSRQGQALVAEQPPDREIHVILDNLSTHKKNDHWLAAHPNVTFHFTPTSASWLNQVEIWFGIFSRKALAGASFASIAQLVQAIRDFTEAYNRNAAPFVWRKREVKGAQLRNTIVNLRN
jgi:transposase